jgi:hypothetical protein
LWFLDGLQISQTDVTGMVLAKKALAQLQEQQRRLLREILPQEVMPGDASTNQPHVR